MFAKLFGRRASAPAAAAGDAGADGAAPDTARPPSTPPPAAAPAAAAAAAAEDAARVRGASSSAAAAAADVEYEARHAVAQLEKVTELLFDHGHLIDAEVERLQRAFVRPADRDPAKQVDEMERWFAAIESATVPDTERAFAARLPGIVARLDAAVANSAAHLSKGEEVATRRRETAAKDAEALAALKSYLVGHTARRKQAMQAQHDKDMKILRSGVMLE